MNPMKNVFVVLCILAAALATPSQNRMGVRSNALSNSLKPTEWLSPSELESLPAVNEVTYTELQNMPAEEAAELLNRIYHLSQVNHNVEPRYVPNPAEIPAYIIQQNGQKATTTLANLIATAKKQANFGDEELTVLITGLPSKLPSVEKAIQKLVQAYNHRYNNNNQWKTQNKDYDEGSQGRTSSEEANTQTSQQQAPTGTLVVIDLGAALNQFEQLATLNTVKTGVLIGNTLARLSIEAQVPQEVIHVVAQGIAAHVAGAAGRQYTRVTGRQLRRITALDPSKVYAKNPNVISGLARGDAEFVDAIHTSAYGMGTTRRVGDVDFFPNGPSVAAPGADNIIEAVMRASRYFAETVLPGNERNFPAVVSNSLQQYKTNNGHGQRAYMGIATAYDLKGDYVLQVNARSPFGRSAPAQRQNTYHGSHSWTMNNNNNRDYE